jgi:serine/threonine-protein kinase
MEFVEGKDLATKLYKEGAIPIDRVVHITAQICDALDEAHSKNVVHRDMKPENVMICPKRGDPDFVKVLDFGIAKIRDGSGDAATFQTATGLIFGTPEYMSPEQIRGEELDGRSDLYSLGIMIYQMLTNKLPFAGNSILEIATKHISYPPPSVREILPDVPEKIDKTILRLLSKKRENRFTSAADLKKALTSVPLLAEKTVLMTPDQLTELSGSLRKMKEARIPEPAHAAVTSKNAGAGTKKHAEIQEMDTAKVAPAKEPAAKQKQVSEKKATPAEGVEDLYDYLDKKEKTFFGRIFSSPTMYIALIFIGIVILITVLFFLSR